MERNVIDKIEGWDISLQRNVHMYCHALSVQKGRHKFNIHCEDLPTEEKTIGIWLYSSVIPEDVVGDLQRILLQWSKNFEVTFQIYTGKEEFLTNKQGA